MRRAVATLCAAAILLSGSASGQAGEPPASTEAITNGMGALCLWGIVAAVAEAGRRCGDLADPSFQRALELNETTLDRHMLAKGLHADEVTRFKHEQAGVGRSSSEVCSSDTIGMYRLMQKQGSDALGRAVKDLTSLPGRPAWGDCL